jgi:hypothetical protein
LNIGSRQYPFSQRRPPFADGECHLPNSRNRWHRSFHRHDGHTRERDDGCRVQRRLAPPDGSACRPGDWHPGRVLQRFPRGLDQDPRFHRNAWKLQSHLWDRARRVAGNPGADLRSAPAHAFHGQHLAIPPQLPGRCCPVGCAARRIVPHAIRNVRTRYGRKPRRGPGNGYQRHG